MLRRYTNLIIIIITNTMAVHHLVH